MTQDMARQDIARRAIAEARDWCGTPYAHQAAVKHVGADCLGLLRGVYAALYGKTAHYMPPDVPPYPPFANANDDELLLQAAQRYLDAANAPPTKPPQGGEVLFFRMRRNLPVRHIGIATNAQHMVHAMSGGPVCEIELSPWWWRHCAATFNFPKHGQTL